MTSLHEHVVGLYGEQFFVWVQRALFLNGDDLETAQKWLDQNKETATAARFSPGHLTTKDGPAKASSFEGVSLEYLPILKQKIKGSTFDWIARLSRAWQTVQIPWFMVKGLE